MVGVSLIMVAVWTTRVGVLRNFNGAPRSAHSIMLVWTTPIGVLGNFNSELLVRCSPSLRFGQLLLESFGISTRIADRLA